MVDDHFISRDTCTKLLTGTANASQSHLAPGKSSTMQFKKKATNDGITEQTFCVDLQHKEKEQSR